LRVNFLTSLNPTGIRTAPAIKGIALALAFSAIAVPKPTGVPVEEAYCSPRNNSLSVMILVCGSPEVCHPLLDLSENAVPANKKSRRFAPNNCEVAKLAIIMLSATFNKLIVLVFRLFCLALRFLAAMFKRFKPTVFKHSHLAQEFLKVD